MKVLSIIYSFAFSFQMVRKRLSLLASDYSLYPKDTYCNHHSNNKDLKKLCMSSSLSSSRDHDATSNTGSPRKNNNNNKKVKLIWHRRDLRLNDNELYSKLDDDNNETSSVSLFIFDNQYFKVQPSSLVTKKKKKKKDGDYQKTIWCGPHAAQALIEAATSLRDDIRSLGGELLIRRGDPFFIVPDIAKEIGATEILYSEEPGSYETNLSQKLQQIYAFQTTVQLKSTSGYSLYHPNDLPLDPNEWDRLAHPKNKHRKKRQQHGTKKQSSKNNQSPSQQAYGDDYSYGNYVNCVDVSPNRFKGICRIMGDFRKAARASTNVRELIPSPNRLITPDRFDVSMLREKEGDIPTLEDLMQPLLAQNNDDLMSILGQSSSTIQFIVHSAIANRNKKFQTTGQVDDTGKDGTKEMIISESAALKQLEDFIDKGYACTADRSKADVSDKDSSRLSVHFALGTLSPRTVYWKAHHAVNDETKQCDWLMSHLEMRDYFLYTTYAAGNGIFQQAGLPVRSKKKKKNGTPPNEEEEKVQWKSPNDDFQSWKRWSTGKSQLPMVDATMLELMSTGYCSNRVRQNVASVLTKDLKIDWRAGAEWFQFLLQDHCVGANYGNWLYFSGVGPDPKQRHFRTISQLKRYDPQGDYVKKWIPILRSQEHQNLEAIFRPWDFNIPGFESPLIDPATQYTWQDLQCLQENGNLMINNKDTVKKNEHG